MTNNRFKQHTSNILSAHLRRLREAPSSGQALIEYALITALLVIAIIVALTATGPAIGNVFSNTVFNLIGAPAPSSTPLNPTEFWELVTAVASYTPSSIILPTNTLAPPTATPTVGPSPTNTPETPTATPTATETPGPSPTPSDIIHDAPFYDNIANPEWWRLDTGAVFAGYNDWNVEWWRTGSRSVSSVESTMSNSPYCTSTYSNLNLEFYWGSGAPSPVGACVGSSRKDDFASRWTRTVYFDNDTTLELKTVSDDGLRVFIDGTLISAISPWYYHGNVTRTTNYTFTGGVNHTVVVEHFEGGGGATLVFTMSMPSEDVGNCEWTMSNEYAHSAPDAWSDSPGRYYSNNILCHLALRGAVNLSTLSNPPRMTFWDRYDLDNYDKAWLQIREYGDTGPWYAKLIHENYSFNLSWSRQTIDLANFDAINVDTGSPVTMDWTNRTIEFRFVLETDGRYTENGWWIDDIAIEGNELNVYTVGFSDDMETGDANWLPGGTWAISSEHTRSGSGAWSDSPGAYYTDWTNASLQLDGIVDLTVPESVTPELVFYHSWYLGTNDKIFAEVSTDGTNWVSLTENRPFEALQAESRNDVFVRESISLASYDGQVFYLRFRIEADNITERDGWWIDDIAIQNRPTGFMPYPFFDDMENGSANWIADGEWAISPEQAYSGSSSWSDSPGKYYEDDSNASIRSALPFALTTSVATNPELSFWYKHYVGRYDGLFVEVSTDDGLTWTSVWSYEYDGSSSSHPEAPGVPRNEFNRQMAWEYVSIDMSSYISDTTPFYIRFRLDALTDNQTRDGVWIDDIRLAEYTENPHSIPFADDMEGTTNWRAGGTWALSNESVHSGSYAWSDSPGSDYADNTFSILELIEPVDLTGLTSGDFPVLTWWERFMLDRDDYTRVQISTWQGPGWSDWSNWTQVYSHYYTDTGSWDRRQVDLRPYIGEKIRLRFVMDAMRNSRTDPGWWIDDVSIDLYNPTVIPLDFYDSADTLNGWIPEGTWGLGDIFRGAGSGPAALGPGSWTARYWDLDQFGVGNCGSQSGNAEDAIRNTRDWCSGYGTVYYTMACEVQVGDIDFTWNSSEGPAPGGACTGNPWKLDHFAIQFERTIDVEAGYYEFSVTHDDGARLYIDGTRVINKWWDTSVRTDTISRYLTAGTHVISVWFYENSGAATIQLDIARQSFSFTDSPAGDYRHLDDMSLILDGVIDMTGAVNPSLSWYDTYDIDYYDCMIAEVSLPFESGQFDNWIEVYRRCYQRNDNWTLHSIPLRDPIETALGLSPGSFNFDNKLLTFRFRLDARNNGRTDPGWWIDDVVLAD